VGIQKYPRNVHHKHLQESTLNQESPFSFRAKFWYTIYEPNKREFPSPIARAAWLHSPIRHPTIRASQDYDERRAGGAFMFCVAFMFSAAHTFADGICASADAIYACFYLFFSKMNHPSVNLILQRLNILLDSPSIQVALVSALASAPWRHPLFVSSVC